MPLDQSAQQFGDPGVPGLGLSKHERFGSSIPRSFASILDVVAAQHTAVLGKTGSGKTSTSKLMVERLVARGERICILDPIKSDWWGLISSADGKAPGLPFHILGGPRGHVPLHSSAGAAIGELVATGDLSLSIIDMADFEPGGLQRFFVDFAPALMKKMRGVLYLVIEEAHEFAPKERAGIGAENLAIHWAKKLATAGRSKGIRLMLLTQRTQALHNAMLGSCETVIVHRLTAPADQEPVKKWLAANAPNKQAREQVEGSLSSLKTGAGWICSGEDALFRLEQFPRISTYDNSATPTSGSGEHRVTSAPVDHDRLRAIIGEAVEEAEANDPKKLKDEIARLGRELSATKTGRSLDDAPGVEEARASSYREGYNAGHALGVSDGRAGISERAQTLLAEIAHDASALHTRLAQAAGTLAATPMPQSAVAPTIPSKPVEIRRELPPFTHPAKVQGDLSRPQQRILDALAWLEAVGVPQADRVRAAMLADQSPRSSGYEKNISTLSSAGLIAYPSPGVVKLTDRGRSAANRPARAPTTAELHEAIRSKISGPQWRLLHALIQSYPRSLSREKAAAASDQSPASSGYEKNVSTLRSLGFIDYPERGHLVAAPIMFLEGRR